jgi:hypothetical protein
VKRGGTFAVRRSPFAVRRSPFAVRRSPFAVRRSPFAVRRSSPFGPNVVTRSRTRPRHPCETWWHVLGSTFSAESLREAWLTDSDLLVKRLSEVCDALDERMLEKLVSRIRDPRV